MDEAYAVCFFGAGKKEDRHVHCRGGGNRRPVCFSSHRFGFVFGFDFDFRFLFSVPISISICFSIPYSLSLFDLVLVVNFDFDFDFAFDLISLWLRTVSPSTIKI